MKTELLNFLRTQIKEVLTKVSEKEKRSNRDLAAKSSELQKLVTAGNHDQQKEENEYGTN